MQSPTLLEYQTIRKMLVKGGTKCQGQDMLFEFHDEIKNQNSPLDIVNRELKERRG